GSGLSVSPDWTAESNQASALFGNSVSTAGDVNGDGYSDVIVGAYRYDNGETDEGRAFVYYGSGTGLSTTPDWMDESNQAGAYFGYSVSTAGDVNGDGYSDMIVGAHAYDNGETDEGRAFVYYGSGTGLSTTPDWTAESNQASAYFGWSVSTAGDVNGDGYSDVIVGAYGYDNGETNEGRAFVYYGSGTGLSTTPDWMDESNQAGAYFGYSVSTAGDVNGDGYSDVIVGAIYYSNEQTYEGGAFVYHGSGTGLSVSPAWTGESNQEYANFGYSVSTAGDVNGDGYSDVIVGAHAYDNGQTNEGRAFVYYGSDSGLSSTPDWTGESNQEYAYFGYSVSTAGDVNGDGYS
ncbi:FG-GAP repeat protein, partial [candidate division WOR-3 bacterium]|nr:FG-GAP repeat protein [candidate division WOR-3 bacterium]